MSKFSYSDYEAYNNAKAAKAKTSEANSSPRVGFFKLADGQTALVRIYLKSIDQLEFASVHHPSFGQKWEGLSNPYAGISCLNPIGEYDSCPLCKALAEGNTVIGKASKKVFVKMLVSYQDAATGTWSEVQPVVWERPAGFARELATKLQNYGDLTQNLLLISRNGSGQDTKYSLDYAVPAVYKPERIPEDFSAFDNFKINKHSYFEVTAEDIETYLTTGSFPTAKKDEAPAAKTVAEVAATVTQATPVNQAPAAAVESTPAPAPAPAASKPATKFGSFSF